MKYDFILYVLATTLNTNSTFIILRIIQITTAFLSYHTQTENIPPLNYDINVSTLYIKYNDPVGSYFIFGRNPPLTRLLSPLIVTHIVLWLVFEICEALVSSSFNIYKYQSSSLFTKQHKNRMLEEHFTPSP